MSFLATTNQTIRGERGGHRYIFWRVTCADVATSSEFALELPFEFMTMTEFKAQLTDPDAAATLAPQTGRSAGWLDDTNDVITEDPTPVADQITIINTVRFSAPSKKLWIRPGPDAHADEIVVEVTMIEGHLV